MISICVRGDDYVLVPTPVAVWDCGWDNELVALLKPWAGFSTTNAVSYQVGYIKLWKNKMSTESIKKHPFFHSPRAREGGG